MNKLRNWGYAEVSDLLKHFGFLRDKIKDGSHEVWKKRDIFIELWSRKKTKKYKQSSFYNLMKKAGIPLDIVRRWPTMKKEEKKIIRKTHT